MITFRITARKMIAKIVNEVLEINLKNPSRIQSIVNIDTKWTENELFQERDNMSFVSKAGINQKI